MARAPELLVLALDVGSSSTRSALFDERGRALSGTNAQRQYSLQYSVDGGAEISPGRLRAAVRACVGETLRNSRLKAPVVAIGGSAFWHGLVGLDGNGRPLTPIFMWADGRAAPDGARLREEFDERKIHRETGCMLRASFWPAKLRWLRRTNRPLFQKVRRWVSPIDWIFTEIFGTSGTSHSMASATGLYDLRTKAWHNELCKACRIDPARVDGICEISNRRRNAFPELRNAQIFNAIGDGAAGNLGSGADTSRRVAINLGTSAAVRLIETRCRPVPFGLFRYAVDDKRTIIGGAVSNSGNLHQWGLRELRLTESEAPGMQRALAATDQLTVLPFWVSERAPTWPENLRGAILGLTQSTDAATILRAITCATFYRLADILELLERKNGRANAIVVSGGILRTKDSLPLLADALGRNVCISSEAEASLRGAAVFVLEKLGYKAAPLPKSKLVPHDRALAFKHRVRRERQRVVEKMLLRWDI